MVSLNNDMEQCIYCDEDAGPIVTYHALVVH